MQSYAVRAGSGASERWQRLALVVWLVIALITCGRALLVSLPRHVGIYPLYAEAGQHWRAAENLYPEQDGFVVFRYSPLVAALLVPIGALPDMLGCFIWRLLNLGVYVVGLICWRRTCLPQLQGERQQALLYLLLAPLSIYGLVNCQANGLVLGLMLLTAAAVATGRWNGAALCMTLAGLLKVYPLAFGLLLAAAYPWAFAGRLLLAMLGGLALPFLLQDPSYVVRQYEGWLHLLASDTGRQDWTSLDLHYRDLRFLCQVWFTPLTPVVYQALQLGVAAALAGICLAGRGVGWSRPQLTKAALGLSCCWMLVLGPCTEGCTYFLLAPSLVGALLEAWSASHGRAYRGMLLASYGVFLAIFLGTLFPWSKALQNLAPHAFAGLILFAALTAGAVRQLAVVHFAACGIASATPQAAKSVNS
jgi:hypothetical protein